jgi:hypothetical protein
MVEFLLRESRRRSAKRDRSGVFPVVQWCGASLVPADHDSGADHIIQRFSP